MKSLALSLATIAFATLVGPVHAHHSPAMFDMTKDIVFEGTIIEARWRNPHVYFSLEVAGADGNKREQRIEGAGVSDLVTAGMTSDFLHVGDRVIVHARPNRSSDGGTALGWTVAKDDVVLPLHVRARAAATASDATAASIAGTWVPSGSGFTSFGEREARSLLPTPAGRAAIASGTEAKTAARAACVPFGPPPLMLLPATIVIELSDKTATFKLDARDAVRVIHLDQSNHPANLEPSVHGHSIGHFEGTTLIVDTTGYAAHPEGLAFDLPTSASKHVVERFALSADGKRIQYEAVVEDFEYYTTPIRHSSEWNYRPDQRPSGLPCDLESAREFTTER